jgi:hypothetical protein
MTRDSLPIPLLDALQNHSLALFIGSDLPEATTGLPSRSDLARGLARQSGLDETLSLAEVAQRVSLAGNRFGFTNYLRNALETAGKPKKQFHTEVARLAQFGKLSTIITTACDNLLETTFQQMGIPLDKVVVGNDIGFTTPERPLLIKLYGEVQRPDTLIVTEQDHYALLRDREREALVDEVRQVFRRKTILFLGYHLSDPDFRFLFDQVAESRFARIAYAAWSGASQDVISMWRDRGIIILDKEPLVLLTDLAAGLASATPSTLNPIAVPTPPVKESDTPGFHPSTISSDLYKRIRQTLLDCGPFESDRQLRAIFAHPNLHPWRNKLPQANSQEERVDLFLDQLLEECTAGSERLIAVFLRILSERLDPAMACHHRLAELAHEIEQLS